MIQNNGDKELNKKCIEWKQNDRWYIGPHKVDIKFKGEDAIVTWYYGGCIPFNYDKIIVKRNLSNLFGLKKIKPFKERLQNAVDEMQRWCDEYDRTELLEKELNSKYHV